jgi:hypothetical protein
MSAEAVKSLFHQSAEVTGGVVAGLAGSVAVLTGAALLANGIDRTLRYAANTFFKWRKERNSLLPEFESKENCAVIQCIGKICDAMYESVAKAVRLAEEQKKTTLNVVIHTIGGQSRAARQIAKLFLRFNGIVNVYIPMKAFSGGTLIALLLLGKGKVFVRKGTNFGPIDAVVDDTTGAQAKAICDHKQGRASEFAIGVAVAFSRVELSMTALLDKHTLPFIEEKKRAAFKALVDGSTSHHTEASFDDADMIEVGVPLHILTSKEFPQAIFNIDPWTLASAC